LSPLPPPALEPFFLCPELDFVGEVEGAAVVVAGGAELVAGLALGAEACVVTAGAAVVVTTAGAVVVVAWAAGLCARARLWWTFLCTFACFLCAAAGLTVDATDCVVLD
jgi:hypothetical protein